MPRIPDPTESTILITESERDAILIALQVAERSAKDLTATLTARFPGSAHAETLRRYADDWADLRATIKARKGTTSCRV